MIEIFYLIILWLRFIKATADFTGLKFTIPIDQCSMDKTVDDENIIHTLYIMGLKNA